MAVAYIEALDRDDEGHYQIRLRDVEQGIDISRRHVSAVRKFIRSL